MISFHVEHARDMGPQFTRNPHRMVGQDGAYSIPFGTDKTLWFFGDTLIGNRPGGESLWFPGGKPLPPTDMAGHSGIDRLLTNTGLLLRQTNGAKGLAEFQYITDKNGDLRQLVPRLKDEDFDTIRVWCQHGIAIEGLVYLSYINVRMLAEGPLAVNFEILGSGMAEGRVGEWDFERLEHNGDTLWWGSDVPRFGSAMVNSHDGEHVYLYGVRPAPDGAQLCYLARVRSSDIADYEAFEYLCDSSPRWSRSVADAVPVFSGVPNELSVAWNPWLGCWLAVHSLDLSGQIVARTAPDPWGPWSEPTLLWQCRQGKLDYTPPYAPQIYAGKEHPELAGENGRILYLTYIEFEEYYPHLIEVSLSRGKRS